MAVAQDLQVACSLGLAGRCFAFRGADPQEFPDVFTQFLSPGSPGDVAACYDAGPAGAFDLPKIDPARIVWQSNHWCLAEVERRDDADLLLAIHALPDERRITVARFSRDFAAGQMEQVAGRHGLPSPHAFNFPCDQAAVLNRMSHLGVIVVHAGAVAFEGQGLLFCGRSGAGKTTLSRLCRDAGATLLNDDRQFLWFDDRGAWLAPTPWHGSEPEVNNRIVPLRAVFHLQHADSNALTPLAGAQAAARLLGNAVAPFYFADGMERVLRICDGLIERVPSHRLDFTPTSHAVRTVTGLL